MTDIVERLRGPNPVSWVPEAIYEIERLRAALVRIQNWYPISVTRPHDTIREIQEFAQAAREAKE